MSHDNDLHLAFERGQQALARGAWREAADAFGDACDADPGHVDAAALLARSFEKLSLWSRAVQAWDRALAANASHTQHTSPAESRQREVQVFIGRAEALRQAGCFTAALTSYDAALALDSDQLFALAGAAEALRMLGLSEESLPLFERAITKSPDHLFALRGYAAALNALRRHAEALPIWEHALALAPESLFSQQGRDEARRAVGTTGAKLGLAPLIMAPRASAPSRRSLTADAAQPTDAEVRPKPLPVSRPMDAAQAARVEHDWGRALAQDARWAEAAEAFGRASALVPKSVEYAFEHAQALNEARQWDAAIASNDRVIALDPTHVEAQCYRGEALRKAERFAEAIVAYESALKLEPSWIYALAGRGEAQRMLVRFDDALRSFDQALALQPNHAFALRGKAASLNALHRFAEAAPYWRRALEADPSSEFAMSGLQACEGEHEAPITGPPPSAADAPARATAPVMFSSQRRQQGRRADNERRDTNHVAREVARPHTSGQINDADSQPSQQDDEAGDAQRAPQLPNTDSDSDSAEHIGRDGSSIGDNAVDGEYRDGSSPQETKLVPVSAADTPARAAARRHFDKGRALVQQQRFGEATEVLRLASEADPSWILPFYLLGVALEEDRQYRRAVLAFEEVLRRDADHLEAACHRADSLRKHHDYRGAIDACDAILERRTDEDRALAGCAESLRMLGRFDESLLAFDETLAVRPNHPFAMHGKAAALNALRRFEEALPLWIAALRDNPNAAFVKRGLANCHAGLSSAGQPIRATVDPSASPVDDGSDDTRDGTASADSLTPSAMHAERRAGSNAQDRSSGPKAELAAGPGADLAAVPKPDDAASPASATPPAGTRSTVSTGPRPDRRAARDALDRGRAFYKERDFAHAIESFHEALRIDPRFAEAALRLGMALEDDRQYRKAIEAYERCLAIDPGHYQSATNIGEAHRKNERYDEAIKAYDGALKIKPDYLYALAGRAECMRMLGDYQASLAWFDKALAVGTRHAFAIQGKAAALNALHQYKDALILWERALEIEPRSQFATDGKAWCETQLKKAADPDAATEDESPTPTLDEQGRDLTDLARRGLLPRVIGRDREIHGVLKTLVRRLKANPLLLGDPGVGKTAVVEAVAQRLVAADLPERLRDLRLIELSMGTLVAGTKYRGTFEDRLKEIVREARDNPGIVLFIDEIHTLVGAGRTEGGSLDAANILKPALARGELQVIGATTMAEYRKHFEGDGALDRRFQPIHVEEPSEDDSVTLLEGLSSLYEAHHDVTIAPGALLACVRLSVRYVPERRLPDKALDLLDEACAEASLNSDHRATVTATLVSQVIAERTGIPASEIDESTRERLLALEAALATRVVGQQHAVSRLARAVRTARSGLRAQARPRGVFLFVGTSGVGKTELARALADQLFPEGKALIRVDMSEYSEKFTQSRLVGAPPGYSGHGEEGQLTGPLRRRPYAVVLLDEFEKAHPEVQASFLSLFDEGRITDAEGREVSAREAWFVITTNAGSELTTRGRLGFGNGSEAESEDLIRAGLKDHFRPELLNRVDDMIVFHELDADAIAAVVTLHLTALAERAAEQGVTLAWDSGVPAAIVARAPTARGMGARPALRALEEHVSDPLGALMLNQRRLPHRDGALVIRLSVEGDELRVEPDETGTSQRHEHPKTSALPHPS